MAREVKITGVFKDQISKEVAKASRNIEKSFKSAKKSMSGLTVGTMALSGAVIGVAASITTNLISALSKLPSAIIKSSTEVENLTIQFEVLLGSIESAQARIEELTTFANSTPFELQELANASRVLETLTGGALSTGDGLRLVGDAAAATGSEFENLAMHVGRAYSGLQANRPVGESMMRLQELGLVSGTVRNKIEELQKAGEGKEAWNVLQEQLDKSKGAMKKLSESADGLMSTIRGLSGQIMRDMGDGGGFGAFKNTLKFIRDTMDTLVTSGIFKEFGSSLLSSFKIIVGELPSVEDAISSVEGALQKLALTVGITATIIKSSWIGLRTVFVGVADIINLSVASMSEAVSIAGVHFDYFKKRTIWFTKISGLFWATIDGNKEKSEQFYKNADFYFDQLSKSARVNFNAGRISSEEFHQTLISIREESRQIARKEFPLLADAADKYQKVWDDIRESEINVMSPEELAKKTEGIKNFNSVLRDELQKNLVGGLLQSEEELDDAIARIVDIYLKLDEITVNKKNVLPGTLQTPPPPPTQEVGKEKDTVSTIEEDTEGVLDYIQQQIEAYKNLREISIASISNQYDRQRAIVTSSLNEQVAAVQESMDLRLISRQEGEDAITRLTEEASRKRKEISKEELNSEKSAVIDKITTITDYIAQAQKTAATIASDIFSYQTEILDEDTRNRIENVKETIKGTKAQNKAIESIEEDAAEKRKEIRKKELMASMVMAIANVAQGVTKAIAQGGVAGLATGLAVGFAGAAQVGIIASQISRLAKGGIVGGQGQSDTEPALLTPGEMVINKSQQSKLFAMANGKSGGEGGGYTINMSDTIIVNGDLNEAAVEQIKVDREKQLVKLKDMLTELSYRGEVSSGVLA